MYGMKLIELQHKRQNILKINITKHIKQRIARSKIIKTKQNWTFLPNF